MGGHEIKSYARTELEKRERQFRQREKREQRRQQKLAKKFHDYEPEQTTHHDLREHLRYRGEMSDYLE